MLFFALDPKPWTYPAKMKIGFRARAERSMLADAVKDKGATTMFPPLAVKWLEQVEDQKNWKRFQREGLRAPAAEVRRDLGSWWSSRGRGAGCPYENAAVRVCRIG